jgi:ribosomal protein L44E
MDGGIVIDTLGKVHKAGYHVSVFCRTCDRHTWIDLAALIAAGHGERPFIRARFRCRDCGAIGETSMIWTAGRR